MKLVFLDSNTVTYQGDVDLAPLSALGDWQQFPTTSPDDTETRVQGADVVICNKVVLNRATLESAPQIKLIAVTATGTNNIDLAAAKQMGMQVCNVSGYSTGSVAQHAIAMMLNLVTNMHQYTAEKRLWAESPIFTRLDHPVGDLAKMTLGIAGAGNIGVRVGEIATSFGMKVQCLHRQGATSSARSWPRVAKQRFFESSDIVTLHCPLTPDTQLLINSETLGWMKSTALLINTGRGELVDEKALVDALASGQLAGAGLDVLAPEPPPANHPLLSFDHPNLLITPHTAWSSLHSRTVLIERVVSNIQAFINHGEADNRLV